MRARNPRIPCFFGGMFLAMTLPAAAAGAAAGDDFFNREIAPILAQHCFECHSHEGGKAKGGLVLDSRTGWMTGGDSGPVIVPGDLDKSLLIEAIRYTKSDTEMPPDGKLADAEIAALEKWVAGGAHDPRRGSGVGGPDEGESGRVAARDLWSFQPLAKATPPEVKGVDDPVDRFVRARLAETGLPPAERAPDAILLRRLHLALTGLPPAPDDVAAFDGENAEAAVDGLLASPAFGEKWGRHWLDLAAYADTVGVGRAIPLLEAWRYRDYVVDAFNDDKPFTEFIRQQIAGDIFEPSAPGKAKGKEPTAESIIATGFLAIGPWELVSGDKVQLCMDVIDKQVHRVGQAFLGMTLGCARCHEHKFDPVSQEDYYAMAGFFKSTITLNGRLDGVFSKVNHVPLPETPEDLIARAERMKAFEAELAKETRQRNERNARVAELKKQIGGLQEEIAKATTNEDKAAESEKLAALEKERDKLAAEAKKHAERVGVLDYVKKHRTQSLAVAVSDAPEPESCRINVRGNAHQPGDLVPRGFLSEVEPKGRPALTRGGSGRVQLAEWIASEKNPLTARVWVNRVWHHLFGEGIVRTVDNFGARGELPSHPELLDYLAAEFMREGWSTKKLVRWIVLSETWRQDSVNPAAVAKAEEIDPDNRLLWRSHRRRLEAEAMRDAMLFVSGQLDETRGGPALPVDVRGNMSTGSTGTMKDGATFPDPLKHRRTVYLPVKRKGVFDAVDFIGAFDLPDTDRETGRRTLTAVPAQALYLVNSPFVQDCGKGVAGRFEGLPPRKRVREIYLALFSRQPAGREVRNALSHVAELEEGLLEARGEDAADAEIESEAWARLCQSLLITNEFLFRG